MKIKILTYLLIFSVLFVIFIYVNDKKILDSKQSRIEQLEERVNDLEVEQEVMGRATAETKYFAFEDNEEAITYFEDRGINATQIPAALENEIISRNRANEDNNLVPFEGMEGSMRINKVHVLNHKWIIADFTDGKYWGELFITYEIDENNNLELNTEKSFLYPVD